MKWFYGWMPDKFRSKIAVALRKLKRKQQHGIKTK
jgi:hypothetical protein